MHTRFAPTAGVAALIASAAFATPADATAGTQSWVMNGPTVQGADHTVRIAAAGPLRGAGVLTQEFEETEGGDIVHAVWHLPHGTVTADAVEDFGVDFHPTSCRGTATASGTWVISGGTGAYAGATGHGTFTGSGTIVGTRDDHGRCLGPESGADPQVAIVTLRGSGVAEVP